jgi:mRNA-degrading endonuclease HigB of HigAB toxin-antitoxin module
LAVASGLGATPQSVVPRNKQSSSVVAARGQKMYRNASVIGDNRIVFNIVGNKYRLIVRFNYEISTAYIRFIGSHENYDKIDAENV